ncbi:hypothetical protein [Streptomyces sp. YIM 98790]|uniref:hypothetical protein n=1 Tax=Streptomyces sp. YIM 98790 TaxID=2689077 RepID=UPI00140CB6C3|nr:hypothetical protein [Streptomyces sp. YIM 98790]
MQVRREAVRIGRMRLPWPELPEDRPGPVRGGTPNDPVALARDGLLCLFFPNGDVISTELPRSSRGDQ